MSEKVSNLGIEQRIFLSYLKMLLQLSHVECQLADPIRSDNFLAIASEQPT